MRIFEFSLQDPPQKWRSGAALTEENMRRSVPFGVTPWCIVKILHIQLKSSEISFGEFLKAMCNKLNRKT
jgi:hypothetical protein